MSSLTKNDFPALKTENLRDEGLAGERMPHPGIGAMAGVGLIASPGLFKKFTKILAGRFGMTLLCSFIVSATLKSDMLWRGWKVFAAVIAASADAKVLKGVTTLFDKGAEVAKQHADSEDEKPKPNVKERIKNSFAKGKEATRNAVDEKVKPLEKDARNAYGQVMTRLGPPNSNAGGNGGDVPERVAPGQWAPPARPDFVAPYTGGGMGSFPQPIGPALERGKQAVGGTFERLGRGINDYQAEQALYLRWWAEVCPYNGRCGRGHPMKINPRSNVNYGCKICGRGSSYPAAAIRYNGPPGPPFVKPRAFYVWKDEQEKKQAKETP